MEETLQNNVINDQKDVNFIPKKGKKGDKYVYIAVRDQTLFDCLGCFIEFLKWVMW